MQSCPCGSGKPFSECCGPILQGARPAATAEELMRARYSAYVEGPIEFLGESLHPDHRDDYDEAATRRWAARARWLGLQIGNLVAGGTEDEQGSVEFIARYREKGVIHAHRERSEFVKQQGRWYFVEGEVLAPETSTRGAKVGRNDPCPCGSGKKYKKCCGA